MKFRRLKKQSTTFKTHFFSALCRSVFTNASLIFANSVFVKTVGGKSYSQLFFFASLASVIYYTYFAIRGEKEAFGVYKAVICLTLLASLLCFLEQFWIVLEPYNNALLYFFAVSVMVVDLIGTTLGPVILQLSVNPAIFREVYQKIVTAELLARISAASIVWLLSSNHWLTFCYPLGWVLLAIHMVLFNVTVFRLRRVERKTKGRQDDQKIRRKIRKSLKFIFGNPMVRVALFIMIWTHVTKFVVECLFYQVADTRFSSARQIASFVSITTMTMIILSLIVQHLVGKRLTERLQLSTLFSFQPVNILVLGSIALIVPPFWPLVLLMVTYNIINRSIQLPVSRQCLVPVPRNQRSTIVSLICILMSTATMVASGGMAILKESLHLQDFLVILLVLGASIFLLITGLDSYYIRNLWSFFREARSGHWQDQPVQENFSSLELESAGTIEAPPTFKPTVDLKSHKILETYAISFDQTELAITTSKHRLLLRSGQSHLVLLGLRICFITGFPWFSQSLTRSLSHENAQVREFARLALQVNSELGGLEGYSSVFRRRIKGLALEFLEELSSSHYVSKLHSLIKLADREAAELMVAALSDRRFTDLRDLLFDCIASDGSRVSVKPVVDHMYQSDYEDGHHYRELLQKMAFSRNSQEILTTVEANLAMLKKEQLALWSEPPHQERNTAQLQRFMHTLFTEEYRLCPRELDHAITDTIGDFQSLSAEDSAILVDMHLEFLKRSELFKTWQTLLT